jgi:microcystin-dependent protein
MADAAGRVVVGSAAGLARGTKVGADQMTLTAAQMPAHAHGVSDPGHAHQVPNAVDYGLPPLFVTGGSQGVGRSAVGSSTNPTGITIQPAGGGQAFDNRQASLALLYCRKN